MHFERSFKRVQVEAYLIGLFIRSLESDSGTTSVSIEVPDNSVYNNFLDNHLKFLGVILQEA